MARRFPAFALSIFTLGSSPVVALAAAPEGCPPDEWFCDEGEAPEEPPAPEPGSTEVPPEPEPAAPPPSRGWTSDEPPGSSKNIVLEPSRRTQDTRASRDRAELSPWSVNLRLQGVLLGENRRHRDAGMGGVGVSLRHFVSPVLTLDFGLDSILGTDYQGRDRSELALSFSTLLYFSRHSAVRSYALLGLNSSAASVDVGNGYERSYAYLGAHAGIGLEVPLSRRFAFNLDFLGFIRGRADSSAAAEPEFTDDFGRVTNTAGGGMFRAGVNLFW